MAPDEVWNSKTVCKVTGVSYRQLDYWIRTGVFTPCRDAQGSGSRREYNFNDVRMVMFVRELRKYGIGMVCGSLADRSDIIDRELIDRVAQMEGDWQGSTVELQVSGPVRLVVDLGMIEDQTREATERFTSLTMVS
jgi:DNA-binding transcriptional MerR regulator